MGTVEKAFSLLFFLHFPPLQTQPTCLRQDLCSSFLHKFPPVVSVLTRPLVVPPESCWQHTGACQYRWQSTWFTFMNWTAWVKGHAVLVLLCNQENQDSSWIYTNWGSPASVGKQDGFPNALCGLRESFSCMVRSINMRHFLFLCWNVRPSANCASSSPWMVAALHTLHKFGTPVLLAAEFPNGILLWLQSRLCTSGKKTHTALHWLTVLTSCLVNMVCTYMLWYPYSHFHRQVSALSPVLLAYKQRIQALPLEGNLLSHYPHITLTTVRQSSHFIKLPESVSSFKTNLRLF